MSMRQIIVLAVALIAAGAALFLVRGMATKEASPTRAAAEAPALVGVPVLVAARPIERGRAASPSDLAWAVFPKESIGEAFIKQEAQPKAIEEMAGAVARDDLIKGEPITAGKLVKPGERGFMAAILEPGYRAVSIPISAETAAGGFILPMDRVDVILTRKVTIDANGKSYDEVRSGVVLEDVRVLAIDQKHKIPPPADGADPTAITGAIATVELTPRDAEALAMADEMGDLSLALRGVEAASVGASSARRGAAALEQSAKIAGIRIHAFGKVDVAAGQEVAGAR